MNMKNIDNYSKEDLIKYIRELEQTNNKLNKDVYFPDLNSEMDKTDNILLSESSQFLVDQFKKNNDKSLRSFASDINLSAGKLSEIFSGKRHLTLIMLEKIEERDSFEKRDLIKLKILIEKENKQREILKKEVKEVLSTKTQITKPLEKEILNQMDHWSYYAIIALLDKKDQVKDVTWISQSLNISNERAIQTLKNLTGLGIATEENGLFSLALDQSSFNSEKDQQTLNAIMTMTNSILQKSIDVHNSLEQPLHKRSDYFNCSLLADPRRIETARKMLANYLFKIAAYLEDGEEKEVYYLTAQLFPLEKL